MTPTHNPIPAIKRQKKIRSEERDLEFKNAKFKAERSLEAIIAGERLPVDIKSSSGEMIVPARHKVTVRAVKKMVACYPDIDIEPSPVRIAIMSNLRAYHELREKILEKYSGL